MSLFQASTCFEHMCLSSGGQKLYYTVSGIITHIGGRPVHGVPYISEYKSDLENKLQTYNKINGAIWRHFEKQMNKETKLRIHNIIAKAALKFGSEAWVLKKREE